MFMKTQILLFLFTCTSLFSFAQDFEMPPDFSVEEKEDYAQYEQKIIEASKWLQAVPFNEQRTKREQVNYFVTKWVNGSPTVTVELMPIIMDFNSKNKGMLVLYMAACSQYVLENNYSTDVRAKHKAALKAMINVYKRGKGIKKDKKMDKLLKAEADGTMDEWLEQNMKMKT
jgi:hypothetical protein